MKRTYTLTITIDEQIAEEYNKLAARYNELTPQEYQDFDFLTDAILDTDSPLVPADDTSTIHWLPVNGTVPPVKGNRYLVHIADSHVIMERTWKQHMDHTWYSHYAELPTFTPVQTIPDYITHEADCPCFDMDYPGDDCTCDMLRVLHPDRY